MGGVSARRDPQGADSGWDALVDGWDALTASLATAPRPNERQDAFLDTLGDVIDPLPAFPRRRYGRLTPLQYHEADSSSSLLRPAALHLRSRSLKPSARAFNPTSC